MPAPLLHLGISCECAARDCCIAFSSLKGVAEQHMLCMRCLWAGERIFEKLTISTIIEVILNILMVILIIGSSLKSVFFSALAKSCNMYIFDVLVGSHVFSLVICL